MWIVLECQQLKGNNPVPELSVVEWCPSVCQQAFTNNLLGPECSTYRHFFMNCGREFAECVEIGQRRHQNGNGDSPAFSKQQTHYTSSNRRPLFAPKGQLYAVTHIPNISLTIQSGYTLY